MTDNKTNIIEKEGNLDKFELINSNSFIKIDDLLRSKECIECILNEFKKKIETSSKEKNLILKSNEISFKNDIFSSLITSKESIKEIKENEKFEIIIDLLHFYNYEKNKTININEQKEILNKLFNDYLTEKGELLLLCDFSYLNHIGNDLKQILGEENKLKILIKLYIVSKVPFLALFTMKKIYTAKEKIDILNEKILAYELYEDLTLTKPISYTISQMPKTLSYMSEIFQYQKYLEKLRPGQIFILYIKELFWTDNIDFSMIICDSDNEEIIKQKKCASVIIGQSNLNNFINLNKQGNLSLCHQLNSSRLIIIRPNPFCSYTMTKIKDRISSYIMLFKFAECQQKSIPIIMMNDENENVDKVFIDNKLLIREIKQKDNIFRQLIYIESPHEIQCEIKILLTTKSKINKNDKKYIPINTIERYKSKNIIEAFDDSYLSMFYTQVSLSGIFFLNYENYPEIQKKILVLGAGVGNINYFMNKIFLNKLEIDAVEIDQKVVELGRDYFGLNNYQKEKNKNENENNNKWYFQDAKTFIEEKNIDNYYDLIIMNIHNTNPKNERSPNSVFFDDKILGKINKMLKLEGIYIMYLMCKNEKIHNDSINSIKNNFEKILFVENNDELNKIYFCFKSDIEKNELMKNYSNNIKNLSDKKEIADIKLIENSSIQLMNKFTEINKK